MSAEKELITVVGQNERVSRVKWHYILYRSWGYQKMQVVSLSKISVLADNLNKYVDTLGNCNDKWWMEYLLPLDYNFYYQ